MASLSPSWRIVRGDCLVSLAAEPPESVDAVVTDPPYELGFMGRAWDASGIAYDPATWAACLRVLKPGGHLLAFGATRTYHGIATAIERAGFEIRDCIAWMYGSGFPKSLDVSKAIDRAAGAERPVVATKRKLDSYGVANDVYGGGPDHGREMALTAPATPEAEQWQGWGTALKPAFEPIVVARKPLRGTVAGNVLAYGTGALNIDGCRIATADAWQASAPSDFAGDGGWGEVARESNPAGRWPANVALDPEAAAMLDEQSGESASRVGQPRSGSNGDGWGMSHTGAEYEDAGGASRFFYCAKASSAEREAGLGAFESDVTTDGRHTPIDNPYLRGETTRRNHHPTVKPIELMRWLARLVTPPGGTILDPFTGSGTTGCAAALEGFHFIGMEKDPDYADLAETRMAWWAKHRGVGDTGELLDAARERDTKADAGQAELF